MRAQKSITQFTKFRGGDGQSKILKEVTVQERKYWNEKTETMPLEEFRKFQEEALKEVVERAYNKTKFYRRLFDEAGVKPTDIKTLEDIRQFPFTTDVEMASGVSFGDRLAVPEEDLKMFHSTSGTVGAVVPIPFTARDVDLFLGELEARSRWTLGVRPWDVAQLLTGADCCLFGYKELGASLVLLSAGRYNINQQINMTKTAGVTVIEHMPSLLLGYFQKMQELGVEVKDTKLRMASGVGEGWAESYKRKVEEKYGLPFMTLWTAVELGGFGAAECEMRGGLHVFADLGLLEVVDPDTGEPLPDGSEGELVVTTLLNEAMPLIRYRVGDISKLLPYEPCPCGRTLPKISYVKGRAAHIIKVSGKKILPIDIEEVVAKTEGLGDQYQIILEKPEVERLKVGIEYSSEVKELKALKERAEEAFLQDLGIGVEVDLVPAGSIERVTIKAQRVKRTYS